VEVERFLVLEGGTKSEVAEALGVSPRTLLKWERSGEKPPSLRGRPRTVPDESAHGAITKKLEAVGPHLGVEPLKRLFPAVPRRGIAAIIMGYREHYAREHALSELVWRLPAAVWAVDHTKSPQGRTIIAVRDLASRRVLEWSECPQTSEATTAVLDRLVRDRGAPLLLKSDQHSSFTADRSVAFLNSHGILPLLSPPHHPSYNGAIESTNRWMKLRTYHQAMLLGNALEWGPEALKRAKELANAHLEEADSDARPVIPDGLRAAFAELVWVLEAALLDEAGLTREGDDEPGLRAVARRTAMERALVAHGILEVRRLRIPLRIRSRPWARIA
jgi:transposase InsO family protein